MHRIPARSFFLRVTLSFLVFLMLFSSAKAAGPALRGYDKESGYIYVVLGQYPQTAEGEIRPILWRVLDTDDEKCILLSEYILFARCMNANLLAYRDEFKGDFAKTDLCIYLNSVFSSDAFTEEELSMLLPLDNIGIIFLPSAGDLKNKEYGLGETLVGSGNTKKILENPGLRAWGTEWAIKNNGYDPEQYPDARKKVTGSSNKLMPVKELRLFEYSDSRGGHCPYWTRDPSSADKRHARCIKASGGIGHIEVGRDNEGVRPMIYLAQDVYTVASGSGTKDDPCVIVRKGE